MQGEFRAFARAYAMEKEMSSHDQNLRSQMTLKQGTTLHQVWNAICDLAEEYDIEVDSVPDTNEGNITFVDEDNVIELTSDGKLFMSLSFWGSGSGIWPDGAEDMIERLGALTDVGGAVELFDLDVSLTNEEESCSVRFVGSTPEVRRLAQVRYGMGLARDWLVSAIGQEGYDLTLKTAIHAMEGTVSAFLDVKVEVRSKTTFGNDELELRVFQGDSIKEKADRYAESYGAEVIRVLNLDGTLYNGPDKIS